MKDTTSWRALHREQYNAKRRELRRKRKNDKMQGKYCLLCEIRMENNGLGTHGVYCKDCNQRYPIRVRQHKWRRYYYRKKQIIEEMNKLNFRYCYDLIK